MADEPVTWATTAQVEEHLRLPEGDERAAEMLAISLAWCQRQRPDLDPATAVSADVSHAVVLFAGLLYRDRSNGSTAVYDELDSGGFDQASMLNVYRLLGTRKPVAR